MTEFSINLKAIPQQPQYQGASGYQIYALAVAATAYGMCLAASDMMAALHPAVLTSAPPLGEIIDTSALGGIELGDFRLADLKIQFRLLQSVAVRLGLYDAADYLRIRLGVF